MVCTLVLYCQLSFTFIPTTSQHHNYSQHKPPSKLFNASREPHARMVKLVGFYIDDYGKQGLTSGYVLSTSPGGDSLVQIWNRSPPAPLSRGCRAESVLPRPSTNQDMRWRSCSVLSPWRRQPINLGCGNFLVEKTTTVPRVRSVRPRRKRLILRTYEFPGASRARGLSRRYCGTLKVEYKIWRCWVPVLLYNKPIPSAGVHICSRLTELRRHPLVRSQLIKRGNWVRNGEKSIVLYPSL